MFRSHAVDVPEGEVGSAAGVLSAAELQAGAAPTGRGRGGGARGGGDRCCSGGRTNHHKSLNIKFAKKFLENQQTSLKWLKHLL